MKTRLVAGFAVCLILVMTACGDKSSLHSAASQPPASSKPEKSPSDCWLYERYRVVDCASLTAFASFGGSERAEYSYATSSDTRYVKPTHFIDLTKVDLEQKVTSNFKLSEFMQIHKGRYAFFAEHVFGFIQNMRDQLGVPLVVTSAYRSPAYNRKIDGAAVSRHMYGDALDLVGSSLASMQQACRAQGASFIQLYSDGHIHCDWRSHKLDGTFYQTTNPTISAERTAAMSENAFTAMQIAISGRPVIVLEGDIRRGAEVQFRAFLEEQEEAGSLFTEWSVRAPNGEVVLSNDAILKYKLVHSGLYNVYVRLGGYSEVNYELVVP